MFEADINEPIGDVEVLALEGLTPFAYAYKSPIGVWFRDTPLPRAELALTPDVKELPLYTAPDFEVTA